MTEWSVNRNREYELQGRMPMYCNKNSLTLILSSAAYLEFNPRWIALIFCSILRFKETRQRNYDVILTTNLVENIRGWHWRPKHCWFSIVLKVYINLCRWPIDTVYVDFRLIRRRVLLKYFLNIDYFNVWVLWLALWVGLVVHRMKLIISVIRNQWDLNKVKWESVRN
jgi:hypothetical protein